MYIIYSNKCITYYIAHLSHLSHLLIISKTSLLLYSLQNRAENKLWISVGYSNPFLQLTLLNLADRLIGLIQAYAA